MSAVAGSPAAPATRRQASGRDDLAALARVLRLLLRFDTRSSATLVLPAVAFAVTTALLLTVVAGALVFLSWEQRDPLYPVLGALACTLLVVPLVSLSGVAARLSARRRDDRLATLRLLGASARSVTLLALVEATLLAAAGALVGVVLHVALVPLVGLIPFGGGPLGAGALWLDPGVVVAVVLGVVAVAALAAAFGLRRVRISPLGVRARTDAPRLRGLPALIGLGIIVAGFFAVQITGTSVFVFALILSAALGAAVAVLNLIGPWMLGVVGRVHVRAARTAPQLIAARSVLEDPKAAWRQVSGVAMTTFIAVVGGGGMALIGTAQDVDTIVVDIRTGIILTLAISFVMVACTVGITQASNVLDRRELWVNLHRFGMSPQTMHAARRREVVVPLIATVVLAAATGGVLVLPLIGAAILFAPVSVVVTVVCFALGFAAIFGALAATVPVMRQVLAESGQS